LKNATARPISANQETPLANTFKLFSTSTGLAEISLSEPSYEVPLINRKRPRDYYFTNSYCLFPSLLDKRDDAQRIAKLASAVISGPQILEMSKQPWVLFFHSLDLIRGRKNEPSSHYPDSGGYAGEGKEETKTEQEGEGSQEEIEAGAGETGPGGETIR